MLIHSEFSVKLYKCWENVETTVRSSECALNVEQEQDLLLNFSTLNPTVGTMSRCFCSSGLKWFRIVVFPELSKPTTRTLHSHLFNPRKLANLSKKPIFRVFYFAWNVVKIDFEKQCSFRLVVNEINNDRSSTRLWYYPIL